MAILIFNLTHHQRYYFALVFIIFTAIQIVLGLALIIHALYIYGTVATRLSSEKPEVAFVFIVSAMYGTQILFHYLTGLKMCHKCYKQPHKKSTRKLLTIWHAACAALLLYLLILCNLYPKVGKHIVRSMKHSLEKGMRHYLLEHEWKETIDKMQYNLKCCGIDSYTDWYKISWLTSYHINTEAELVKQLRSSKDLLHLPVLPWSCCRLDYPMQCFHDPLQQLQSVHLWSEQPDVPVESIHAIGCLETLRAPIQRALKGYVVIAILTFIMHIFILIISRILYTSCRNALLLGNPYTVAPGWLYGPGDPGYRIRRVPSPTYTYESPSYDATLEENSPEDMDRRESGAYLSPTRSIGEPISSADERSLLLR